MSLMFVRTIRVRTIRPYYLMTENTHYVISDNISRKSKRGGTYIVKEQHVVRFFVLTI